MSLLNGFDWKPLAEVKKHRTCHSSRSHGAAVIMADVERKPGKCVSEEVVVHNRMADMKLYTPMTFYRLPVILLIGLIIGVFFIGAGSDNGFDLSNSTIDRTLIKQGGPPRDGIPAIDQPRFIKADDADYLSPADRILGLSIGETSRAYPVKILNWHEIVNDSFDGDPVSVTYCPLCGTGVAFDGRVAGRSLEFGVSGLLYNSDVLLYDRQTESLWSQIAGKAISGKLVGTPLTRIPLTHTSWEKWRRDHPDTEALSDRTGHNRDYGKDPYAGYEASRGLYFEVQHKAPPAYHPKERVLGLEVDGIFKAYPFIELGQSPRSVIKDHIKGKDVLIHWDENSRSATATDAGGRPIPVIDGFWFAWFTFHPETLIYKAQ